MARVQALDERVVVLNNLQADELRSLADEIKEALAPCLGGDCPTVEGPCFKCRQWMPTLLACEAIVHSFETASPRGKEHG